MDGSLEARVREGRHVEVPARGRDARHQDLGVT